MRKLPNIFDDLDVLGIVVECSSHQAKRFGAFTEDAITMEDAQLSAEIENRRLQTNQNRVARPPSE